MSRPRLRFSLSRQLALWAAIYLGLASGVTVWVINEKLGFGWRAFLDGEVGDPVFVYLTGFEPDFQNARSLDEVEAALKKIAAHTRMDVQLVAGRTGRHLAGGEFDLPPEVLRMHAPPGGQPGGPSGGGRPGGPTEAPDSARVAQAAEAYFGGPQRRELAPGERPPGRLGSKLQGFVSRDPQYYWIIHRLPIPSPQDSVVPRQASMILRTASPWTALGNLDLAPLGWPLAALALGSLLFWSAPIWWITRRLRLATAATERIAAGNFDVRLAVGPVDEIGRLSISINELSRRLAEHVGGQRRFIGDVAHEITAPLARLQFAVGILAENAERDPALRPAAEQVHHELARTLGLVDELLGYARSGLAGSPQESATLALKPLVERIVAAEGVAGRTTLAIPETLSVRADPKLLERALANLARNFLRHTSATARLTFAARHEQGRVVLDISDDGPGAPADILARLGEPFFRPAPRAPDQPGHGLGLAIVRTCVSACGGEVAFRDAKPRGFASEITLPGA